MQLETIVKNCLFQYVQTIVSFEKALIDTYNLEDNPYQCQRQFPRSGKVNTSNADFIYRFHGAGCSFEFMSLDVHYDYYIPEEDYIIVSPWKFWRFVATYQEKNNQPSATIEEVAENLERLNGTSVKKRHPDYLQYQVCFSWYKNYQPSTH